MKTKLFLVLILLVFSGSSLFGQIPQSINYQGVLTEPAGGPVPNGNYDITFRLYDADAGGTLLWNETQLVAVENGIFNVILGDVTPFALDFDAPYWLSIQVAVDPELSPRVELTGVPYSFSSASTEGIQHRPVDPGNPVNGQVLKWDGSFWAPADDNAGSTVWQTSGNNIYYNQGNVGIGTTSPDQQLSVHTSSGSGYIRVSDNTTGPSSGLRLGLSGSGNAYIINDESAKSLSLGTDGTSQMRITDIGRVGINELTPDMMLHIKQDVSNKALRMEHQSTTEYWENGIGVTTKNYKFYYNNLFRADISSVDGAYTQSSDRNLKKDIDDMESVLDKVKQLKPSTFNYVDFNGIGPKSIGFIAQDVESIFPDLVRDGDDGYKGLVYDGFAVIAIKAIQEQQKIIEELQKKIEMLERR